MVSLLNILRTRSLLHMGCKDCGSEEAYLGVKVLKKLGVGIDSKEFQCGCEFFGIDDEKITALATENKKLLSKYGTVIVGCARCLHVMRTHYKVKARHITEVIYEKVKTSKGFIGSGNVLYHDPCFLARYERIMTEPREILTIMGYDVKEFKNNKEKTDCCGDYSPLQVVRARGAELRLAQAPKTALITSACPKCTQNLSAFNSPDSKITVKPFLELVDKALNKDIPAK